ncbi:tetraacyldisaccharide 4'-kinase [Algicella marina]|uniref:Tetraacyldisaccharide 4'-kinase n=1 Tax=Algicella marina TaxID=2683284 RepID=A0A6P1T5N1_9RHOB|nr:tetraacyldisaccharide 4'-kinase [Algicella marina]QHQ36766.1 tetraacyldisaccharide 4'-kinase [Algicella marina]
MRQPGFWQADRGNAGVLPLLLSPLAQIWTEAARRRVARPPIFTPQVPVICVGNISIGGTGKTPVVTALLARLADRKPHVISRGHGGSLDGPLRVEPTHRADEVGDEPLLLAAFGPVWVAKARAEAAVAAQAAGAGTIIMDDGFQNPEVAKTVNIVVVDAETGFGNGRVIPAGPLREPLAAGLARADLLVTLGPEAAQARLEGDWPEIAGKPRLRARLAPLAMGLPWKGRRVLAFAGIGRPAKFFATLRAEGADVVATRSFSDHAPYGPAILSRLKADAQAAGAQLVTTEKDAVRLPDDFRREVQVLPVRLESADWAPLDAALSQI